MILDRNKTLLLVIDPQEPFLRLVEGRERAIAAGAFILQAGNILHLPIVTTLQNPERMGGIIAEIAEFIPENSKAIRKMAFSAAEEPLLLDALKTYERSHIVIIGAETNICVLQTALQLKAEGYEPYIPADAVACRKREDGEWALQRMLQAGITIGTSETAIYELMRTADAPEFRAILSLIKAQ